MYSEGQSYRPSCYFAAIYEYSYLSLGRIDLGRPSLASTEMDPYTVDIDIVIIMLFLRTIVKFVFVDWLII